MISEKRALATVADLMVLAARTAPKAKGVDTLICRVLDEEEIRAIAARLALLGKKRSLGYFLRDSKNFNSCGACVVIGVKGHNAVGLNCGACGYKCCAEFLAECKKRGSRITDYAGPNCAVRMADIGIAAGSAVKTAQVHNADNRIMYTGGVAAIDIGLLDKDCTVAYTIPLSATGKNIFFDRS